MKASIPEEYSAITPRCQVIGKRGTITITLPINEVGDSGNGGVALPVDIAKTAVIGRPVQESSGWLGIPSRSRPWCLRR